MRRGGRGGRPAWLRPDEQERLLSGTALYIRPHTSYRLALGVGLACSEIASLEVHSVSADGRAAREALLLDIRDQRRKQRGGVVEIGLDPGLRHHLERYLVWRRARCAHVEHPMRGTRGRDGVVRCASCGDVLDFLAAPLFVSRLRRPMTPDRLRREFTAFRDALALRPWLHFDILRETFLAGKAVSP